jgi:hypothetical protein
MASTEALGACVVFPMAEWLHLISGLTVGIGGLRDRYEEESAGGVVGELVGLLEGRLG